MDGEERKAKQRERTAQYRERQKAKGINPHARDEQQKKKAADRAAKYRSAAHERGEKIPSETWWTRNRERHRANVAKWRIENVERAREVDRQVQASRRSTPWGKINNNMWPSMHGGIRRMSSRWGRYNVALGYRWIDLRLHLEAQFDTTMTWDNWGQTWEVDHIIPLSSFQYTSLSDPLFTQAWALSNLRPLCRVANGLKGNKMTAQIKK